MDRYIYTLFEMGLIIGSAILTNIIVHKKKGYDTYFYWVNCNWNYILFY